MLYILCNQRARHGCILYPILIKADQHMIIKSCVQVHVFCNYLHKVVAMRLCHNNFIYFAVSQDHIQKIVALLIVCNDKYMTLWRKIW